MTRRETSKRTFSKALFISILIIVVLAVTYSALEGSKGWPVPEEAKQLSNPLPGNEDQLKSARKTYSDKCANCHGTNGKGDGDDAKRYDPAPTNFTEAGQLKDATDGELFYKISEGKKPMPVFKTKLTEQQRWELVLLVRSFAKAEPKASTPY